MGPEWFPDLAASWVAEYADKYGVEGNGKFFKFESEEQMEQAKRKLRIVSGTVAAKEMWEKTLGQKNILFQKA